MSTVLERKGVRCHQTEAGLRPSVSGCLNLLYPDDTCWIEDEYLAEGTRLHAVMADFVAQGCLSSPAILEPRLDTLKAWLMANVVTVLGTEVTVPHQFGYVGTADLWFRSINGHTVIVDYKFAQTVAERYYIQVEAYRKAAVADEGLILQVNRAGDLKVIRVKPNPAHWAAFLAALHVAKWRIK